LVERRFLKAEEKSFLTTQREKEFRGDLGRPTRGSRKTSKRKSSVHGTIEKRLAESDFLFTQAKCVVLHLLEAFEDGLGSRQVRSEIAAVKKEKGSLGSTTKFSDQRGAL
jgi:hypothetical protein